ncbi:MAG: tyrosine-type recombinase/integrase [Bacteriovoracaceae bacterium]|nr:tyrosine-type recombinase/integrase [Bacteriovoracaceae bacterium]
MDKSLKTTLSKTHRLWMELFLENCSQHNKSVKTILNYRTDLCKFLIWTELVLRTDASKVDAKDISAYLEFLDGVESVARKPWYAFFWGNDTTALPTATKLSPNSKRRHLSTLNNFFIFLHQYYGDNSRRFQYNPVKSKIHYIKVKDVDIQHTTYLQDEDWTKIWDAAFRVRDKLLLALMYYGGMRLEEVVNLDYENFNFETLNIKFERKGGYVHEYQPFEAKLIFHYLERYLLIRTRLPGALFINKHSKRVGVRSTYGLIMRIVRKAGLAERGISPHSFRKACATNLYRATKDLLLVRDYLHHSDAKVTQTYIEKNYQRFEKENHHPEMVVH